MATDSSLLMVVVMKHGALVGGEAFPAGTYRIGRGEAAELRLPDPRIAAHHASLSYADGLITLRAEGEHSDLLVNGEPVHSALINPGDEVEIGPFVLDLRLVQKREAPLSPSTLPDVTLPGEEGSGETLDDLARDAVTPAVDGTTVARPAAPHGAKPAARRPVAALLAPRPIPGAPPGTPRPAPVIGRKLPTDTEELEPVASLATRPTPGRRSPRRRPLPQPLPPPTDSDLASGEALDVPVLRVQLLWGDIETASVVQARTFLPGEAVLAGASDRLPLPVYGFPFERGRALARFEGNRWQVLIPEGVELLVRNDGGRKDRGYARADHAGSYALAEQESAVLRHGAVAVELVSERAGPRLSHRFAGTLERSYLAALGASLCLVASVVVWSASQQDLPDFVPRPLPPQRAYIFRPPPKPKPEKPLPPSHPKPQKPDAQETPIVRRDAPVKQAKPAEPKVASAVDKLNHMLQHNPLFSSAAPKTPHPHTGGGGGLFANLPQGLAGPSAGLPPVHGFGGYKSIGAKGIAMAGIMGRENVGHRAVALAPTSVPQAGGKAPGTLPMDAVQRVVDAHMGQIRACYDGALMRNSSLTGKLVFEWTIGTDGAVKVAKVKTMAMPTSEVASCIREHLVQWRFPQPKGGVVVVSYPFLFNAVGG